MTARSPTLRELCRYAPCFVDWPHDCVGYQGCEAMHSDSHIFGRGIGHKSTDLCAAGCRNAHAALTAHVGDEMEREQKFFCWLRAMAKTLDYFIAAGWLKADTKKAKREGTIPA